MAEGRFKEIKIDYYADRDLFGLTFKEKKSTDAKWLTRAEVKRLGDDIINILQISGKK